MSSRRHLSTASLPRIAPFAACVAFALVLLAPAPRAWAKEPTVEDMLSGYRPVRPDIEIETPPRSEWSKCKKQVEVHGKTSGWVILGPAGQVLRRFVDSDGDHTVDQWRYYNHGLEVYRDIDTNHNHKPDEHRWLNTGGSRWAVDSKEDGTIDSWKVLSPEEAVRVAIYAMQQQDEKLLESVLVTRDELRTIGVADPLATKIMDALSEPGRKLRDAESGSKILSDRSAIVRADNLSPCAIPAEEGKTHDDLIVYENAMAIVESQGKTGLVQVGELVRIGDVWKLTQIPQPIEGQNAQVMAGGALMQPTLAAATAVAGATAPAPEVQKILSELQELDLKAPQTTAAPTALANYNASRADLLGQLVAIAKNKDDRNQWMRQMIDSIASAVQIGAFPGGIERLKSLETQLRSETGKSPLVPYVAYRRLLADYTTQQKATTDNAKQQDIQKWWRDRLEDFAKDFPASEDAPEALLQLAIAYEFTGKMPDARKWYTDLATRHPDTRPGHRAEGALRRLDLKGKQIQFTYPLLDGSTFDARGRRGRVLLIAYWSTWCTACTQDVPVLKELYKRYQDQGLEIVGVNLDVTATPIVPYLQQHKIPWPQVFQPGGTESEPAMWLGVIVPPVMILVDRQGIVTNVTTSIEEIKTAVPEEMGAKKAAKADTSTR